MGFYFNYREKKENKPRTLNEVYAQKKISDEDFETEVMQRWSELHFVLKNPLPFKNYTVLIEDK